MFGENGQLPDVIRIPNPRMPREQQQDEYLREIEIDPAKYTPEDVQRQLVLEWKEMEIDVEQMKQSRLR